MRKIPYFLFCFMFAIPCFGLNMYEAMMVTRTTAAGCSASYGSETLTSANATDDAGGSETDATTGWTNNNCDTFDSIDTAPQTGTYHLTAVSVDAQDYFYRALSGSAESLYKLSMYIRHNGTASNNGAWRCGIGSAASAAVYDQRITPYGDDIVKTDTDYAQFTKYIYLNARQDTINCVESNTDNDGGIYVDNASFTTATPCYGSEAHTDGNAASISNEANSVGSFATVGTDTFESTNADKDNGTYSLHMVANDEGGRFTVATSGMMTEGHKYLIGFKYKYAAGDGARCGFATTDAFSTRTEFVSFSSAESAWTQAGFSIVYSATNHAYFGCQENGPSNNSEFYFDTLSIKEITGE